MKSPMDPHPVLFLVSAPSGAGKTTLCHRLLQSFPEMTYSVSSTTRVPREGEVHGRDYDFLERKEFEALASEGEFLEHATVHGNYYGTRLCSVKEPFARGQSVLMDVDVQGAEQIRNRLTTDQALSELRGCFVDVFIAPPSLEVLHARLVGRGKDAEDVIECRMRNAVEEMEQSAAYQYHVINEDLEKASDSLSAIYQASRLRNPSAY